MRAVRFSAQLGFTVDPDTAEAAKKLAGTLSKISAERIQTELVKLLVSPTSGLSEVCLGVRHHGSCSAGV